MKIKDHICHISDESTKNFKRLKMSGRLEHDLVLYIVSVSEDTIYKQFRIFTITYCSNIPVPYYCT